jgi:hypothetical protein
MSPYYRFIPSYTELFPLTVGHNVNLNKLQAVNDMENMEEK